jgi:hypothetical protein
VEWPPYHDLSFAATRDSILQLVDRTPVAHPDVVEQMDKVVTCDEDMQTQEEGAESKAPKQKHLMSKQARVVKKSVALFYLIEPAQLCAAILATLRKLLWGTPRHGS